LLCQAKLPIKTVDWCFTQHLQDRIDSLQERGACKRHGKSPKKKGGTEAPPILDWISW
jgi:hypothetical protein